MLSFLYLTDRVNKCSVMAKRQSSHLIYLLCSGKLFLLFSIVTVTHCITESELRLNKEKWVKPGMSARFDAKYKASTSHDGTNNDQSCDGCQQYLDEIKSLKHELSEIQAAAQTAAHSGTSNNVPSTCDAGSECASYMKRLALTLIKLRAASHHHNDDIHTSHYKADISLNDEQWSLLNTYANTEMSVSDMLPVITEMISTLHPVDETTGQTILPSPITFQSLVGIEFYLVLQILLVLLLSAYCLYILCKIRISFLRLFICLCVSAFIISIPWTWLRLYKEAVASKQAELFKNIPSQCRAPGGGSNAGWTQLITDLVYHTPSILTVQSDRCQQYSVAVNVDPIFDVSPATAVTVTIAKVFVEPVELMGSGINRFIRNLLTDMPLAITWYTLFIVMLTGFLFMFMAFGYSIRVPWLLHIEQRRYVAAAPVAQAPVVQHAVEPPAVPPIVPAALPAAVPPVQHAVPPVVPPIPPEVPAEVPQVVPPILPAVPPAAAAVGMELSPAQHNEQNMQIERLQRRLLECEAELERERRRRQDMEGEEAATGSAQPLTALEETSQDAKVPLQETMPPPPAKEDASTEDIPPPPAASDAAVLPLSGHEEERPAEDMPGRVPPRVMEGVEALGVAAAAAVVEESEDEFVILPQDSPAALRHSDGTEKSTFMEPES